MRWPDDVRPGTLRQPDQVSCGAASVVAARVLLTPWRPDRPSAEIQQEHRALTSSRSPRDRMQVPWPQRFGTPPWAVANALRALTGRHVATVFVRPRPEVGHEVLQAQLGDDRPVAVFIGSRWLPRHVVLAVRATDGGVEVFDPAGGALRIVGRSRWVEHRVDIAGWSHFWFVV
jgi:hypothetical protein